MREVEIHNKVTLTVEEAAAYSNIGQTKIRALLKIPRCPFLLTVGNRQLIKRKAFEEYIDKVSSL